MPLASLAVAVIVICPPTVNVPLLGAVNVTVGVSCPVVES